MSDNKVPAVELAKRERNQDGGDIKTLSTGVRVRVLDVPPFLIDDARAMVKYPSVPMWYNENKEREEENPNDPNYIKQCEEVDRQRGIAVFDALVMFGTELIDGLPGDTKWIRQLEILNRRGNIDLSAYDLEDDIDLEFLYKKYVALRTKDDFAIIGAPSEIKAEEVEAAEAGFQGDEERSADSGSRTEDQG